MSDPSRLDLLRFLERVQLQQLDQTRRWIAAEEERATAARRTPPPVPDWVIAYQRSGTGPVAEGVHVGGCGMAAGRTEAVTREQALRALTVDAVPACPYCRPDSELGVLES
ncbi:DUF6233 domain-containing protein [Streptomyces sp. NPDC006711]|uniref:DUF6233 domain-containing protein n=1 Tax=Streptomyces sp. NPDC006711 TaxID=3364762 RepID=UPI0036CC82B3